jgi:hypothetical protein
MSVARRRERRFSPLAASQPGANEQTTMTSENATATATEAEPKLSPVEGQKAGSRFLRGTLAEEVADPNVEHLSETNKNLIKFHGSYQQEDRDARKNRGKAGVGKAYMFMIRLKLPGGKLRWTTCAGGTATARCG